MEKIEKKMGRPTTNPKTIVKRARMSEEDVRRLEVCCLKLDMSESDIIREGIKLIFESVN